MIGFSIRELDKTHVFFLDGLKGRGEGTIRMSSKRIIEERGI